MTNPLIGLAIVLAITGAHTLAIAIAVLVVVIEAAYFWYLGRE